MALVEGGVPVGVAGVIEFGQIRTLRRRSIVTTAQILALFATPIEIVPAPGAGRCLIFEGALLQKPAGVAYAGIAAGEDLAIKYTDASGLEVAQIETTGFLDSTSELIRWARAQTAASGASQIVPVANAALVLHLLVAEIITGDTDLNIEVHYRDVDAAP